MILHTILALLPLLAGISATGAAPSPLRRADLAGVYGKLEGLSKPGFCLQYSRYNEPKAGDSIFFRQCAGNDRYAQTTFYVPDVGTEGPIYVDERTCVVPSEVSRDRAKIVLGSCDFKWTVGSNNLICAADGQYLNIAKEDETVQTWTRYEDDDQFSECRCGLCGMSSADGIRVCRPAAGGIVGGSQVPWMLSCLYWIGMLGRRAASSQTPGRHSVRRLGQQLYIPVLSMC